MPNVHLGAHFERFVQEQLEGGRFQNASEVVRAGLRLLEDLEGEKAQRRTAIRAELAERAGDGQASVPAEDVFDRLQAHHEAEAKADRLGS